MASLDTRGAHQLIELARSKSAAARAELATVMSDLFLDDGQVLSERERALMTNILGSVLHEVEVEVRRALAERLSGRASAPRELIVMLANDLIEVARPILERSEVLQDVELVEIILHRTREHQLAIALRRALSETVSDALVENGDAGVIEQLLKNPGARISKATMAYLVDQSRRIDSYRNPLVTRADLGPELARRMYFWVSAALRKHILEHYEIDPLELDESLDETIHALLGGQPVDPSIRRDAAALAELLYGNGAATPPFLARVLEAGETALFVALLGKLTGLRGALIRRLLGEESGEAFAIIARALDMDRECFARVFALLRHARPGDTGMRGRELKQALEHFDRYSLDVARQVMRGWARSPEFLEAIQRIATPMRPTTRH